MDFKFFYFALISLFLWGIQLENAQANDVHTNNEVPVVLMSGGYASCPDQNIYSIIANKLFLKAASSEQMYLQFKRLEIAKALEKKHGNKPIILFTCYSDLDLLNSKQLYLRFGEISNLSKNEAGKKLSVVSTKHYKVTHYKNFSQIDFNQDGKTFEFIHPLFSFVKEKVDSLKSKNKKPKIYFFGHSYGGFLSLHIAHKFKDYIQGIATADPISPLRCLASDMVYDPIGTFITGRDGCMLAPNDSHSKVAIKNLIKHIHLKNDRTLWWYHSYQQTFSFLQSGAILPMTVINDELVYTDFPVNKQYLKHDFKGDDGDAHSQMARLDLYWDDLYHDFILGYE